MLPIITAQVQFRCFNTVDLLASLNIQKDANHATLEAAFAAYHVPAKLTPDEVGNVRWHGTFPMTMSPEVLWEFLHTIAPFASPGSTMYYQDQHVTAKHSLLIGKEVPFDVTAYHAYRHAHAPQEPT